MLLQVLNYIKREKMVSMDGLRRLFDIDSEALEPLLKRLINKQLIASSSSAARVCAAHCKNCFQKLPTYYYIL